MRMPRSASFKAVADVSHGCADEVSSNSDPLAMVSIRPPDPSATSCTHAPSGSMVNTMSELAPTPAGLSAIATEG